MIATCLAFLAISLHPGQVVTLPRGVPLAAASRLDWAIGDRRFAVPAGTRGIVTRLGPDGVAGVVEVRLFDGTGRLGWLDGAGLGEVGPAAGRRAARPEPADRPAGLAARYARPEPAGPRRRRRSPDFAAVDAAIAAMFRAALRADAAAPCGPIIVSLPVVPIAQLVVPIESLVVPVANFNVPIGSLVVPVANLNVPVANLNVPIF